MDMQSRENIVTYYNSLKNKSVDGEKISKTLLEDSSILKSIPSVNRRNYKGEKFLYREMNCKRNGRTQKPKEDDFYKLARKHRRNEEYIAMILYDKYQVGKTGHSEFGNILDYQTPLGGNINFLLKNADERLSKVYFKKRNIDLISYNKEQDIIYILELKVPESKEPLIRSVLEGYTYLCMLNKEEFIENMKLIYPKVGISKKTKYKAAPLIYKGCDAEKHYNDKEKCVNLHELMNVLEIKPILLETE